MHVYWRWPRKWKSRLRTVFLQLSRGLTPPKGVGLGRGSDLNLGLAMLLAGLASPLGCSNNFNLTGINGNTLLASNPKEGGTTGFNNTGAFTLSRVIKNSLSPNDTLDLIGDGSGTLGNLCLPVGGGSGGATAPTVCNCTFTYSSGSNPSQQVDTPVTYHETNLVRCNYSGIPRDVTSVQVAIHLTSAGTYSNNITFNFSGTGVSLSASDPGSFAKVNKYQCRDIVVIPYALDPDSKLYDPLQSEDFHLTYPLDFYATNIGNAIASYVTGQQATQNWSCPPILTPEVYLTGNELDPTSALGKFNAANHVNPKVYSKGALSGSKLIYPTQPGVFDRSTFYLSKQSSGVFNIAVNGYQSPGIITAEGTVNPPLGFGASPIATAAGQESCPDTSVTIPTGFHWVKLWSFRASLPQRHFAFSQDIGNISGIACNPGNFAGTNVPILQQCTGGKNAPGTTFSLNSQTVSSTIDVTDTFGTHALADRSLDSGQCVQSLCTDGLGGCADGADSWQGQDQSGAANASSGCDLGGNDPLHICDPAGGKTATINGIPYTTNIGTGDLDTAGARYDFLFVVSPPSISLNDMLSSTSVSLPYQPYRFFTDTDCQSSDPDSPTSSTDCLASNAINNYGLKLHDAGSNGDPPSNDPTRAGVFPVCALQPD